MNIPFNPPAIYSYSMYSHGLIGLLSIVILILILSFIVLSIVYAITMKIAKKDEKRTEARSRFNKYTKYLPWIIIPFLLIYVGTSCFDFKASYLTSGWNVSNDYEAASQLFYYAIVIIIISMVLLIIGFRSYKKSKNGLIKKVDRITDVFFKIVIPILMIIIYSYNCFDLYNYLK